MPPASDDNTDGDDVIYTRAAHSVSSIRTRLFGGRRKTSTISTTPGRRGAAETETELDEPPRYLPTTRIIRASAPLIPPTTLEKRLTPLLFEFSRLLAIVPAVFGTLYNLYRIYHPPSGAHKPERIDFFVSALWAILTGHQCLALTTGLLTRWRVHYPPLATLIRLLALQAICWPATHLALTLSLLDHARRPAAVWAVIGTMTCASRSVQMWVTSNVWRETQTRDAGGPGPGLGALSAIGAGAGVGTHGWRRIGGRWGGWRRIGGRWGGRRWDWGDVGFQCMLPAGLLYFVMAWAEQLRREWSTC
ncbi:N-glycosylation protein-domain-containing protein [Mycena pura]|uniref:N-glycosylation protein-domain-containing protein n=1 Tax=Mycena pura TaxID=153505 RepID=A0AAD6YFI5_9AGAR|nr:N-glycosylation protein-domain-containing protein [Mycena pura]